MRKDGIALMSGSELNRRINREWGKLKELRDDRMYQFKMKAREVFDCYMLDKISRKEMNAQIQKLEEKFNYKDYYSHEFMEAVRIIFSTYFYGRKEIERSVEKKFRKIIEKCMTTISSVDYLMKQQPMNEKEKNAIIQYNSIPVEEQAKIVKIQNPKTLEWILVKD